MKTEKSNKGVKVIKTILMVIGAGALAVYFSKERNRSKSQEKALELGNYLLGKVKEEKDYISNKTKDLIRKTKTAKDDIDSILSDYGKKTF
jgi:uncharacterized protein YoxC